MHINKVEGVHRSCNNLTFGFDFVNNLAGVVCYLPVPPRVGRDRRNHAPLTSGRKCQVQFGRYHLKS